MIMKYDHTRFQTFSLSIKQDIFVQRNHGKKRKISFFSIELCGVFNALVRITIVYGESIDQFIKVLGVSFWNSYLLTYVFS